MQAVLLATVNHRVEALTPALAHVCPCLLIPAGQLVAVLRWWGKGGEESGSGSRAAPTVEGLTGKMCFSNAAKSQWTMAVLDEAEPGHCHTPGSSKWERLRRTMPPAARALLQELGQ